MPDRYLQRLIEKKARLEAELAELNKRMSQIPVPDRIGPDDIARYTGAELNKLMRLARQKRELFYRSMDVGIKLRRIQDEIDRLTGGG